ncbi:MAG TPA: hypothetical protein VFP60_01625 [Pseudolabrys sp.]|nr:hypothetical protein [Pseudolabrys sp.]
MPQTSNWSRERRSSARGATHLVLTKGASRFREARTALRSLAHTHGNNRALPQGRGLLHLVGAKSIRILRQRRDSRLARNATMAADIVSNVIAGARRGGIVGMKWTRAVAGAWRKALPAAHYRK